MSPSLEAVFPTKKTVAYREQRATPGTLKEYAWNHKNTTSIQNKWFSRACHLWVPKQDATLSADLDYGKGDVSMKKCRS